MNGCDTQDIKNKENASADLNEHHYCSITLSIIMFSASAKNAAPSGTSLKHTGEEMAEVDVGQEDHLLDF
eukprot:scaffold1404_cov243-Chaetoceros_neogracile.AAC.1